jgi:hypothetical protein
MTDKKDTSRQRPLRPHRDDMAKDEARKIEEVSLDRPVPAEKPKKEE